MPASPRRWWSSASLPSARSRTGARSGREKFLERVWAWKAESGGAIVGQLKRLGASCDWSRERFTLDEGLSKAVAKVFVAASSRGADLQGQAPGQLGPEVPDRDLRSRSRAGRDARARSNGRARTARRSTRRRSQGARDAIRTAISIISTIRSSTTRARRPAKSLTVATTRPETMLGDTAVAVHPDDERFAHLIGRKLRLPLVGRLIAHHRRRIFRSRKGHRRGEDHAGA